MIFPKYGLTPLNNEEVAKAFEDELGPEVARMVKERASVSFVFSQEILQDIQCDLLQFLKPEVIRHEFACSHQQALAIASAACKIRAMVYKSKDNFDEVYRREEGLPSEKWQVEWKVDLIVGCFRTTTTEMTRI